MKEKEISAYGDDKRSWWLDTSCDLPEWIHRIVSWPYFAGILAVTALLLGLAGSLFGSEIRQGTRLFLRERQSTSLISWMLAFWICIVFWLLCAFFRAIAESNANRVLIQAITHCPNPRVLATYKKVYERLAKGLKKTEEIGPIDNEGAFHNLEKILIESLKTILGFVQDFSNRTEGELLGCNIMFTITPSSAPDVVLKRLLLHYNRTDETSEEQRQEIGALGTILYMPSSLVVSSDSSSRYVEPIALPVPHKVINERFGTREALLGAPGALLTGRLSVIRDTRKLDDEKECADLCKAKLEELKEYFGPKGGGRNIRSFASIRIGTDENHVGILNIDSSVPNFLGPMEYYLSFFSLISPMLFHLRKPLTLYNEFGVLDFDKRLLNV